MRRLKRSRDQGRICIPIVERTASKAIIAIGEASRLADLIELRMDYLKKPELILLMNGRKKPFIVTHRRKEEGGKHKREERKRIQVLEEAVDLGAEYVDVEMESERALLEDLMAHRQKTQIILSFHDFHGTPSQDELKRLYDHMAGWGADIRKIVTFAKSWEDNLKVLSLISYAKEKKQEIVAFCMGEKGKMSRIFAPLMGTAWTYASLDKRRASAPGQLTISEMQEIWERLR